MMLQSSLDWLWKLVVWGGLVFKMYIFKVVWFGFGPVAQTTTRVMCMVVGGSGVVVGHHHTQSVTQSRESSLASSLQRERERFSLVGVDFLWLV